MLVLTRQRIECAGDDHAGNEHGQDDVFSLSIISLKPEYIWRQFCQMQGANVSIDA